MIPARTRRNCRSFLGREDYLTVTSDIFFNCYSILYTNCKEENRRAIWIEGAFTIGGKPVRLCRVYYSVPKSTNNVQQNFTLLIKPIFERDKYIFRQWCTYLLRRCICWRFHTVRATRGRVAKFQFLKKLSRLPIVFLLQISFKLKILEHYVKNG